MHRSQVPKCVECHRFETADLFQVAAACQFRQVGLADEDFRQMECILNLDDPCLGWFDQSTGVQRVGDNFPVGLVSDWDHCRCRVQARDTVDRGDLAVDGIGRPLIREFANADSGRVSVSFFREAANKDSLTTGDVFVRTGVIVELSTDDVCIKTGAADVLANLIDDE